MNDIGLRACKDMRIEANDRQIPNPTPNPHPKPKPKPLTHHPNLKLATRILSNAGLTPDLTLTPS
eukprot:276267-Amorphochlora_amoeboformis.AAC.1